MTWVNAVLTGMCVLNIGLTIYHATILCEARRYRAKTAARLDEVTRLLAEVRRLHGPVAGVVSNGHRAALDAGPEP